MKSVNWKYIDIAVRLTRHHSGLAAGFSAHVRYGHLLPQCRSLRREHEYLVQNICNRHARLSIAQISVKTRRELHLVLMSDGRVMALAIHQTPPSKRLLEFIQVHRPPARPSCPPHCRSSHPPHGPRAPPHGPRARQHGPHGDRPTFLCGLLKTDSNWCNLTRACWRLHKCWRWCRWRRCWRYVWFSA